MRRSILVLSLIIMLAGIAVGCANSANPLIPAKNSDTGALTNPLDQQSPGENPNAVTDPAVPEDSAPAWSHQLWGLFEVRVDPEAESLEIVPMRDANIHLNALKFLEPNGKPGNVQLAGPLQWNGDHTILDLDLRLVHPFANAIEYSGFDVKGIVMTRGTMSGFSTGDIIIPTKNETRLLNPDGLTRWWNPDDFPANGSLYSYRDGALGVKDSVGHFESTMNGFKYFSDTLSPNAALETLNQADRGAFRAGQSNIRHYTISLKSGLMFNYAVDASWAPPLVKPPIVPDDFPASANQLEPWRIVVVENENSLYYLSPTMQGGQLVLDIHIYDWQSPLPASQSGTIERVVLEWPNVFYPTEATFISDEDTYGLWRVTVKPIKDSLTSTDPIEYLVWAESSDGAGYQGLLSPDDALITADRYTATVSSTNPPPQISSGVDGNAAPGLVTETYSVTAFDPNGDPLTYSWSVEDKGDPYNFDDPGAGDGTVDIDWGNFGMGEYTVQVQVTDGVNAPIQAIPLDITVANTPPAVGQVTGKTPVTSIDTNELYQASVSDPDAGQTLTYKWSKVQAGNPENFILNANPDGTINLDWSTDTIGSFGVNVQVTDGIDTSTGTKLTVVKENSPPEVGAVSGPTPVTCADTAAICSALITEHDSGQALTVLWSLVPAGAGPVYNIPAAPDHSFTHDWSDTPLGDYDINVQVDDGYGPVTGTLLTVTKENTPPSAGAVDGLSIVYESYVTDYSINPPASDCDSFQSLEYKFSIVPKGDPANYDLNSSNGTITVEWSVYGLGEFTIGARVSDGIAQSLATPLDVVVSLKPCNGSAHSYDSPLTAGAYSVLPMTELPRRDIAFLDGGGTGFTGLGIAQVGPATLGVFDADESGSTNVLFTYFLGDKDTAMSIDTEPIEGRVLCVTQKYPGSIKIIDPTIIFGPCIIGTLESGSELKTWVAMDAEANGNIWAVQRDTTDGIKYWLFHCKFKANDPYYQLDASGTTNITPQVSTETDIFDIAINQVDGYLYLLEAGGNSRGVIDIYKLAVGSQAAYQSSVINVFSQALNYEFEADGYAGYADIDVDHIDSEFEPCRVLVYGRLVDGTGELRRLDSQLQVLDIETYSEAWPAFAINPNESVANRNLIMPSSGSLQFWTPPVDW